MPRSLDTARIHARMGWLARVLALAAMACGDSAGGAADSGRDAHVDAGHDAGMQHAFLDADGQLPASMSALGLYPDTADLSAHHPQTTRYVPRYPLWSNGGAKDRLIYLPEGEQVDTSDPSHWRFPIGTMFFKTFSFENESGTLHPVETRVLYRTEDEWSYAMYLWDEDGTDATLTDLLRTHPVAVYEDGEAFEHVVPSRRDCDKCHESNQDYVIGFDELRLNTPLDDETETQLEALAVAGLLSEVRDEPAAIEHDDPQTRKVLGYLHGNCGHCHNGLGGPSGAFDLRYPVALDNLIDQRVNSEGLSGIRVVPGEPDMSVLYLALTRDETDPELRPMPPVGVQRIDTSAIDLIRSWIEAL